MIQDYSLTLKQHACAKSASDSFDVVELVPNSEYTVQIRSLQAFDQATKNLQKTDINYPLLKRFESSTNTCEFELFDGPPDEVFIYQEPDRVVRQVWSKYQPVIETVQLQLMGQNVDSVTLLDTKNLYYATKHNSNIRADTNYNLSLIHI